MTTDHPHEQTIVAVDPKLRATERPEPESGERRRKRPGRLPLAGGGVALAAVGALAVVFFGLPRWLAPEAEPPAPAAPAPEPAAAAPPAVPELTPEEREALRQRAEALLAELLPQQQRLADQGAEGWGGEDFARYTELSRQADDAFLAEDFKAAVSGYEEAFALGEALLDRSRAIVERAFAAAQQAFLAGDAALAIEQYDVVLGIDPEHAEAAQGRARAERLPEVLAAVRRGDQLRDAGALEEAAEAYREALAIDDGWAPARNALDAVTAAIADARFERLMSSGYAALAEEDYESAAEHFQAALAMRPGAQAARDGLTQAEQGAKLDDIALAEARALAFERRELWQQAVAQYEAALATDETLAFAITGLERARKRADLDAKLAHLIENPDLLLRDAVLEDANRLLEQARAVPEAGPRLTKQVEDLERLVTLATTPVTVALRSDQQTEVTLYRVGKLGVFTEKVVELRPGTYTAVGSRDGYRDVRRTFTVLPGRELPPIDVVCSEPI
ncbi:MAG TPA: hypothetical protein VF322_00720 [Gammaproteobacteria bacterium]